MFRCEYCKKDYSSTASLLNHQKTTKRCIEIQRQLLLNSECNRSNANDSSKRTTTSTSKTYQEMEEDFVKIKNELTVSRKIIQELNMQLYEVQQLHEQEIMSLITTNNHLHYENNVLKTKLEDETDRYNELVEKIESMKRYNDISRLCLEYHTLINYSHRVGRKMYQNLRKILADRTNLLSMYIVT